MGIESPYSYHTFLFPFLWNRNKNLKSIDDFVSALSTEGEIRWAEVRQDEDKCTNIVDYADTQYFKRDAAKVVLFSGDRKVVRHYRLMMGNVYNFSRTANDGKTALGQYIIHKGDRQYGQNGKEIVDQYRPFRYVLDINYINLTVYKTGIAVLSLELEYWGDKIYTSGGNNVPEDNCTVADINAINEHGRRICLPYVGDNIHHALVADKIEIKLGEHKVPAEDFSAKIVEILQRTTKSLPTHYIMEPLRYILSPSGRLTTDANALGRFSKQIFIEPIIDDRMYVCCVVRDDFLSLRLKQQDNNGNYLAFSSPELYQLAFIENSLSCPSERMRPDILHRCIYDRWIDWGTIDIITHHSMIRLTGTDVSHVVDSFLTQYVKMAQLVVAQRATLIALENACVMCGDSRRQIVTLQKKYVDARKDLLLEECTTQEQGIEEFRLLRQELFVEEQADNLDKRLNDLYELKNLQFDWKLVWFGLFLAALSLLPMERIWSWVAALFGCGG